MTYSIKIQTPDGKASWNKDFTEAEEKDYRALKGLCQSRKTVLIFPAALIPVRSDNCKNFCKDFFLPTLINQALQVKSMAGRVFAAFFAILFDLITFPIRLLTCIPTVICNKKRNTHPLHKYLSTQKNVDPKLLQCEYVKVKSKFETVSKSAFTEIPDPENPEGEKMKIYERTRHTIPTFVNFINIPVHDAFDRLKPKSQVIQVLPQKRQPADPARLEEAPEVTEEGAGANPTPPAAE